MKRRSLALLAMLLLAGACSGGSPATPPEPTATQAPTTTQRPATTQPPATTAPPTTQAPPTTAPVPTTQPPATSEPEAPEPGPVRCPDLFRDDGDAEFQDVVLAAWSVGGGELLWEVPLGTRWPRWGVWSDQILLGFPDGHLVGLDAATCASWTVTLPSAITDLAVIEQGSSIAVTGDTLRAFAGPGFASWRLVPGDAGVTFVADNAGVSVFVDGAGTLYGIGLGGEVVFEWAGAALPTAVAVSETFAYRSTGTEVAARPVSGGSPTWTTALAAVDALYAAPGTLLAFGGGNLHALEPPGGGIRWTIPFDGPIAGPVVLDHGELHIASGTDTLWHLDPADGSTVFRGTAPEGTEWFPEMDDALVLEVGDDGTVAAIDMRHREVWRLATGANRVDRFTQAEVARGAVVVTLTYSAERF